MKNGDFDWHNYNPVNRLSRSELAKILALDQYFVVDRMESSEGLALSFNDRSFLECLCNRRAFLEQFAEAARLSERSETVFNLRIKLRADCTFEAYLDEGWHDLVAIEAVALDQTLRQEAALAQPRSLDVVAVELLQSAWCQLSLDAHLHLRQGLLAKGNKSTDHNALMDVERDDGLDAESIMMRLN